MEDTPFDRSVCTLSGTSVVVMSHCDIHHECTRREPIVFSVWLDDIILDLDVTTFIVISRSYSMCFKFQLCDQPIEATK